MTPWLDALDQPLENPNQVFYIEFDGAQNVVYEGPVTVKEIDVPAFEAGRFGLAGQEGAIIANVATQLEETFAGTAML